MKEWSDKEWKLFFEQHAPHPKKRDRWFTRRVMNRLPRKRWSAEMWVSCGVTVAVLSVCASLYWIVLREMLGNDCWTCASTWGFYFTLVVIGFLAVAQLGSFLNRLFDAR